MKALEQREEGSVLWRRCCDVHAGNSAGFTMNVTRTFQNDAMLRQITESVKIDQTEEGQLINTKEEWTVDVFPDPKSGCHAIVKFKLQAFLCIFVAQ